MGTAGNVRANLLATIPNGLIPMDPSVLADLVKTYIYQLSADTGCRPEK